MIAVFVVYFYIAFTCPIEYNGRNVFLRKSTVDIQSCHRRNDFLAVYFGRVIVGYFGYFLTFFGVKISKMPAVTNIMHAIASAQGNFFS